MAITKAARSKIFTMVQEIKKLLVLEVASQLQQFYGIRPDGSILLVEQLPATEPEILHTARLLRQRIDYIKSNIPSEKKKEVESIKQLLNEQAFSILNRFATLRMAEERGIIKETIRKEYNSEGFQIFDSITGQGAVAEQYIRYKWYLHSIFDELSIDLPSIFDRFSPYALIFPNEKAMRSLLTIINNEAVTMHREEGKQPMNLWREDETIGWIYQYYNSREEISEMREVSDAPRNGRELAVRNQFFTPRYVVQFLTDNSLGKIWYEMTKGKTELINKCQYLIRRPKELFLDKENTQRENAEEETDYMQHRPIKDPREILMLDPACGSMHFGLYSFDLFEQIYTEAWDNYPELMLDLRNSITRRQYINQIPEFIIRYNIHGVDIDPRALQIAALSLWLRAQKSFEKLNLEPDERPQITKSNLVLAEAMPGSVELLSELVKPLDAPMRKLVLAIWNLMKMAGETGLLLRIEEEIDRKINEIAKELIEEDKGAQLKLNNDSVQMEAAERAAFYSTKKYRDSFLENASIEVFRILKELAETANEGEAYQKLLFADDAARGFAFIELCRKKYDVVLMNPPFGASCISVSKYVDENYPTSKNDLAAVFIDRMLELITSSGFVGSITTRNIYYLKSYEKWRHAKVINHIESFIDFGMGVLDALVETSATILQNKTIGNAIFLKANVEPRENNLKENISNNNFILTDQSIFKTIPNSPICYWIDKKTESFILKNGKFKSGERSARKGIDTPNNFQFVRNSWEIVSNKIWRKLIYSDYSSRFYIDFNSYVNFDKDGLAIKEFGTIRNADYFNRPGLSWAFRTNIFKPHLVPEGFILYSGRFNATFETVDEILAGCALLNSNYYDFIIKLSMERLSDPLFNNGVINEIPYPNLTADLQYQLKNITISQYKRVKKIYHYDERSCSFISNSFLKYNSLHEYAKETLNDIELIKTEYLEDLKTLNDLVFKYCDVTDKERNAINAINNLPDEIKESEVFNISKEELIEQLLAILVGCAVGRWDLTLIKFWKEEWVNEKMFKHLEQSPFLTGNEELSLNSVLPDYRKQVKDYLQDTSPIRILTEYADSKKLASNLREVIFYLWPKSSSTIEFELLDKFVVNELESLFTNPNKFFDIHLKYYTRNKRISPIYWPISTSSGSYTIWLYYSKITDQTLVAAINNHLQPKIDDVKNQIKPLETNPNIDNKGLKELAALKDFEHELEEMKKELLRITALPYKPNHDDGVLITAAPLYNLFRHTKWRKSTEDCWKALEKGEYDWAHLAYSIWPDRVSKKCKKDLSMAIAHGLENICEIKPKEKKAKATKAPKKGSVNPQLKFEE